MQTAAININIVTSTQHFGRVGLLNCFADVSIKFGRDSGVTVAVSGTA